jgi:hypothetical protein
MVNGWQVMARLLDSGSIHVRAVPLEVIQTLKRYLVASGSKCRSFDI